MGSPNRNEDLQPLVLHAFASAPNPVKIGIALELLKVPYKIQIWEFGSDPEIGVKGAKFAPLNENGRVPVLEDPNTGVTAWESGAVMNYIRRRYDKDETVLGLAGKTASGEMTEQDRVDLEKWELLLLTTVGPMSGQLVWYTHYNQVENLDARARFERQVYRCYDVLESQLAKSQGKSIMPGGVTSVDLHWIVWTSQPEFVGLSLERYPLMRQWVGHITSMPEVHAALAKLQEAAVAAGTANMGADGKISGADKSLLRAAKEGQ